MRKPMRIECQSEDVVISVRSALVMFEMYNHNGYVLTCEVAGEVWSIAITQPLDNQQRAAIAEVVARIGGTTIFT